ncbi:MAG: iron ABC transporter permease [Deltaproteobacteria bacterium]|uniref:Iron ABC transporter permease n=1 Tax=Candidatus Zymogenus saltonus TaxID=2844893 RepID=A0A9D8KFR3_9DELT|nr:iron ABC transporter permease [Candidatus Zymogenus saltonus]
MGIRGRLIVSTVILVALAAAVAVFSLGVGSAKLSFAKVIFAVFNPGSISPEVKMILFGLRLPRLLMGLLAGGALALAGVVFQALLRNPLADPFILGVSSGAALGTIAVSVFGGTVLFNLFGTDTAVVVKKFYAFIGAMTTVYIVFRVARVKERLYPNTMLLTGVIVNAFFSAGIMFLVSISQSDKIHGIFFWLMGNLSLVSYDEVVVVLVLSIISFFAVYYLARPMNLLLSGEEAAASLGVEVERIKEFLFILASILTASVVSVVGVVGFVGLVIPHMMRMVVGPDHRVLIPASFLFGGSFLALADTAARTIVSPLELPVGVLTALFGAPFFIYLLRREM